MEARRFCSSASGDRSAIAEATAVRRTVWHIAAGVDFVQRAPYLVPHAPEAGNTDSTALEVVLAVVALNHDSEVVLDAESRAALSRAQDYKHLHSQQGAGAESFLSFLRRDLSHLALLAFPVP